MDRFLGRYVKRVDAKGRVSVPAPFRAATGRDGFDGLFCVRSLWHPAIDAGGHALVAAIDGLVAGHDVLSPDRDRLATALLGDGELLAFDGEGRIILPGWMREATGIAEEVAFVGQGDKFQFWAPARLDVFAAEARQRTAALLAARPAAADGHGGAP